MKRAFIPKNFRYCFEPSHQQKLFEEKWAKHGFFVIASCFDKSTKMFIKDLSAEQIDKICLLHYENLGVSWSFSYYKQKLVVHLPIGSIETKAIYHRHPGFFSQQGYQSLHQAWLQALQTWPGRLIGQRKEHFSNASKMHQATTTLFSAKQNLPIKVPNSFFVKGKKAAAWLKNKDNLIVKSASSWRSQVVDAGHFCKWPKKGLEHLPTLFQEKLQGKEIRVHLLKEHLWPLCISQKTACDYRYGDAKLSLAKLQKQVALFCQLVAKEEKNTFVGIDLFYTNQGIFCLEANPGPGWGSFSHPSRQTFSNTLFQCLTIE